MHWLIVAYITIPSIAVAVPLARWLTQISKDRRNGR